jgi:hypothetical protein
VPILQVYLPVFELSVKIREIRGESLTVSGRTQPAPYPLG